MENMNSNLQSGNINVSELVEQKNQGFTEQKTVNSQLEIACKTTIVETETPQYPSERTSLEQALPQSMVI
eukprot:snap_masked-scaffold_2-processed-gene-5.27-mRNA-1 protein AED:1.00 eAED:1.00 QI:0/-1/0/0/-1/1/1/0/69